MKKKHNRKKIILDKTIIVVLFMLLILIGTAYALLSQEAIINGSVTIPTPRPYSGWGEVSVSVNSYSLQDGNIRYQFNATIHNTSNANIQGWLVKMDFPENGEFVQGNNGEYSIVNDQIVIYNQSSNAIITPGNTINLYFEMNATQTDFQLSYLSLNGIQMNLTGQTVPATAIHINQTDIHIYPNQVEDLTVGFEPYNGTGTIVWSSSNTSVATITSDTGVLTGVAPGRCVITARSGNLTDTCNVTVESDVVETENLEIRFTINGNPWEVEGVFFAVQYSIHITNLTDQIINNWSFDMVLPAGSGLYQNAWGCTITDIGNSKLHVESLGYDLRPGVENTDCGMILKVPTTTYIP